MIFSHQRQPLLLSLVGEFFVQMIVQQTQKECEITVVHSIRLYDGLVRCSHKMLHIKDLHERIDSTKKHSGWQNLSIQRGCIQGEKIGSRFYDRLRDFL